MPLSLDDLASAKTLKQTAELLGLSYSAVKRLVASGDLAAVYIGNGRGQPRITERALLDYINRRHRKANPQKTVS